MFLCLVFPGYRMGAKAWWTADLLGRQRSELRGDCLSPGSLSLTFSLALAVSLSLTVSLALSGSDSLFVAVTGNAARGPCSCVPQRYQLCKHIWRRCIHTLYYLGHSANICVHTDLIYGLFGAGTGEAMVAGGFESRMHMSTGVSEAALLGVVYTEEGVMTAAPYEVVEPEHWVFSGTGLAKGSIFGAASFNERIPGGASGHETDKISPSSPPGTHILRTNACERYIRILHAHS